MLIVTSQSAHPFQLAEFRDHVGIGYDDDDPALQRSLDAAVLFWETSTRSFTRTTSLTLDWYCPSEMIYLGGGTLAMSAVSRLDGDGTTTEDVSSQWYLNRTVGNYEATLTRSGVFRAGNRYTGTFTVTVSDIDPTVRAAVYGIANHLFMNRDVQITGTILATIPYAVRAIITMYQRGSI